MTMNYDQKLLQVLERAQNGLGLTRDECIYLLKFDEASPESSLTRSVANDFTRKRLNNGEY